MKQVIRTGRAPEPGGSYSQAVRCGDMVYVAGTCPFEIGSGKVLHPGEIEGQTRVVLQYIGNILEAAGTSMKHVVKVTSFLADLNDFKAYNLVYSEFFPDDPPARSTVEIGKFPEGMRVEVECIAYIPRKG